jgi:hypothetical protein
MGNRERVIAEIDRLRKMKPGNQRREQFDEVIRSVNHVEPFGFVGKVAIGVVAFVCFYPMIVLFSKNPGNSFLVQLPIWVVYVWLIGGLYAVCWAVVRLPKRLDIHSIDVYDDCMACGYNLDGHASVLGDDVWVGPEVCPECGERYPAIG